MKYLLATLGTLLAAAVAIGGACYWFNCEPALHAAVRKGDALEWIRADFHPSDQQFAAIVRLHESYSETCAEHCRLIREAGDEREVLVARGATPAEIRAADDKVRQLRSACESAITGHVRQVAALMPPEDGRRYLALVLPKIASFDHQAAPDLHLDHGR